MKLITRFFQSTYWFWFVSRIILSLMLIIGSMNMLSLKGLRDYELIANYSTLILGFLLIFLCFQHVLDQLNWRWFRTLLGILVAIGGISLIVLLQTFSLGGRSDFFYAGYPFGVWITGIGIFDLWNTPKPE